MRRIALLVCIVLAAGCESETKDRPDAGGGGPITLSGTIVEGTQSSPAPPPVPTPPRPAPGDPLAGYQLYCVTFSVPPSAESATADQAGQVSLTLAAEGVPFGCFVLDSANDAVAALVFSSGGEQGQTVTLTEDMDLGSIRVDLANGVALTELDTSGTLSESTGFTCPLGEWEAPVSRQDCTGTATTTFWIAQDPEGAYRVSYTLGPVQLAGTQTCGTVAQTDIPATMENDVLTLTFPADPTCEGKFLTVSLTPNGQCTELSAEAFYSGCASCTSGCECGGELTCPLNPTTATRK